MKFRKYMHIERFGTSEVDSIELGTCYVFPKIDGTNASVWLTESQDYLSAGSRTRELTLEKDNAGFYQWTLKHDTRFLKLLYDMPHLTLYGEWLVPHSLKTYREDAWCNFYVFDVWDWHAEKYMHYNDYKELMEEYGIDYIPPICIITNPTEERLYHQLTNNNFLIQDGKGGGEGLIIKNYDFVNKYGRTTWAKIVTSEFKERHSKTMGPPEITDKKMVEREIVDKCVTQALCEKVYAKINNEVGWTSKCIPRLLNTVYYDLVKEEAWNFVKDHKNPIINFKILQKIVFQKVKEHLPKLF